MALTSNQQPATSNEKGATSIQQRVTRNQHAFTLLEVLIVLFILGMIAVMAWPALGILDDRAREELTCENMEVIRRAIVGDPDRFDADGRRIIGGYVGDMEKWPDLWEAKAEVAPSASANCESNCTCADGDTFTFGFRPAGRFVEKRWKWCKPFRKVLDGVDDHIGGLETENEGQPRGLWTRDLNEHPTPADMIAEGANWKGPYMVPPMDECLKDSDHWAETCNEYMSLEPVDAWLVNPTPPPDCERVRTWEDGEYTAEHFDEKESFRLLQTDGMLADGWGRALRFFITADQDRPGSTIFWIISEGPDREGTYPAKGTFGGANWSSVSDDIMSKAYNKDDDYNKDNIVMKIYSHEWEAIFEEINEKKKTETEDLFLRIKKAILGSSPGGMNDGFTGDVCRWPKLFRWEGSFWDDEDPVPETYTKGQLRELWTRTPNSSDALDNVNEPAWTHAGIGWRHAYFQTPWGFNGEQFVRDAWDRDVLFFKDNTNDAIMILSRGVDEKFDFKTTNADKTEPVDFTEAIDVTAYDPNDAGGYNADNIVLIVNKSDWAGYFRLEKFTVLNATVGTTKARLFYDDVDYDIRVAGTLVDADGDLADDDWKFFPPPDAFNRNDVIKTGHRYLVFWNDDGDGEINTGEMQYTYTYNIVTSAGSNQIVSIMLDASVDFTAAP